MYPRVSVDDYRSMLELNGGWGGWTTINGWYRMGVRVYKKVGSMRAGGCLEDIKLYRVFAHGKRRGEQRVFIPDGRFANLGPTAVVVVLCALLLLLVLLL